MNEVKIWNEKVTIPTYGIGKADKNPLFLEKRVYQGSSGKVYPYPTIDTISDEKTDKEYNAVFLENEYIKIMILPELGGRIQRAYDKTNGYDFVYYNQVIKPALVGLTGPWISGGIEFNWPQHHRPTTFMPTDWMLTENDDGSKTVMIHDFDRMYGTQSIAKFTLYPGKAYLEIEGQLYNGTPMPQTFLWWANPAVSVNDYTQSIFPPDVHAVMDHGKRDVSRFPIATGEYYKMDYSMGVDISRYKNIPVPTSYMAEKSNYDFVGGYDYSKNAGILHVADHHVSPGKKQWTWGCGDFGQMWDKNLTDCDGPYIELMTGVFTDNQPDFTWLKPFEEKSFKQYFMPYKEVGEVKNASTEAIVNLCLDGDTAGIIVYTTSKMENVTVELRYKDDVIFNTLASISPVDVFRTATKLPEGYDKTLLTLTVYHDGRSLISYTPESDEIPEIPQPAKAAKDPEQIMTNEELYLTGLHIEQYRHATFLPDPYYIEGLKRDPDDIRLNNAYGMLLLRRGLADKAEKNFKKALVRLTERNPNPYSGETFYNIGLALLQQGKLDDAYDRFYKATWTSEQQETAFYFLAAISATKGEYKQALEHVERALIKNSHNIKARGLKAYLLRKLGKTNAALRTVQDSLEIDPFDFVSATEKARITGESLAPVDELMRGYTENYINAAIYYGEWGAFDEAVDVLTRCNADYPMLSYYKAYFLAKGGKDFADELTAAESATPDRCFPNRLEDIKVLEFAIGNGNCPMAEYYLGNLYYDKLQYGRATSLWESAAKALPNFPTVHRNLSLAYYNKLGRPDDALACLAKAFQLDKTDARVFLELDQLRKKLGHSFADRLIAFRENMGIVPLRDDLYVEYVTLLNLNGLYSEAYSAIMCHKFHPWEGGEGKVTTQYILALTELAAIEEQKGNLVDAEALLRQALTYPDNLGEGKLEGCKDNDLYYALGNVLAKQGKDNDAAECYRLATRGDIVPTSAMYYNSQPANMILYQGLSHRAMGNVGKANTCFYRLLDYGERHLNDEVRIEYFAVSLPDFLIFEDDFTKKNRAHCYYLMGLAYYGLGNKQKAIENLQNAIAVEPSHMMCKIYLDRWSKE